MTSPSFARIALPLSILVLLLAGGPSVQAESDVIEAATLLEQLEGEAPPLVLDVRTSREFASGHVPTARNVPVQELEDVLPDLRREIESGRPVVVYCERGGRASRAESMLRDAGFSSILHLKGDMSGWRSEGRPISIPQ